jgi:hypothetical protein
MVRYHSLRHRRLMDESEHALHSATDSENENDARIAKLVVNDNNIYQLWEARHAQSVIPIAEERQSSGQIIKLRIFETQLVHRRALVEHVRDKKVRGAKQEKLFSLFYGPRDFQNAVLAEHRQYTIAMSSRVSADHLIDLMHDPVSTQLLQQYETVFKRYFALSCYMLKGKNEIYGNAMKPIYEETASQLKRIRRRIETEKPLDGIREVERQSMLAQSGRYPVRNYMVG